MDTIKRWARKGDAVRQAIELGALVHLDTASEECTDEFLLFAIQSGLLSQWAAAFPDPRCAAEMSMEVSLASHVAARFAGRYSMRQSGSVLRSAAVWGALGESLEGLAPTQGLSGRGPSDAKVSSGDGLRTRLGTLEKHVALTTPRRLPPCEPSQVVKGRQREARRAVKGAVDVAEAEARAQRVAAPRRAWDNDNVGPARLAYARMGQGRRLPIVDTTPVEVPRETGSDECSGVVQHDDGTRSRGYKVAPLRTLLAHAGLITPVGLGPMPGPDVPLGRLCFETASVLRAGDVSLEARGFVDGATRTVLQQQRPVDVMVPLTSTRLASHEAVPWADGHEAWQPPPSRDHQHLAFVQGGDHLWETCQVPLNAWVRRDGNRKKKAWDSSVLVTTDPRLPGAWIVRH